MEFPLLLRYLMLVLLSLNLFLITVVDSQNHDNGSPRTSAPPPPPKHVAAQRPSLPKAPPGTHLHPPPSNSGPRHPSPPPPHSSSSNATSPPPPSPHSVKNAAMPPPPSPQSSSQPNRNTTLLNSPEVKATMGDKKAHTGNTGKKIGLLFIGIAGFFADLCCGVLGFQATTRCATCQD